ncbi:hypothetical protein DXG01_015735 [Tephrocybe rancida]|nr:hypothetical protein DXG01_015735 [Tephrocybe rancida]
MPDCYKDELTTVWEGILEETFNQSSSSGSANSPLAQEYQLVGANATGPSTAQATAASRPDAPNDVTSLDQRLPATRALPAVGVWAKTRSAAPYAARKDSPPSTQASDRSATATPDPLSPFSTYTSGADTPATAVSGPGTPASSSSHRDGETEPSLPVPPSKRYAEVRLHNAPAALPLPLPLPAVVPEPTGTGEGKRGRPQDQTSQKQKRQNLGRRDKNHLERHWTSCTSFTGDREALRTKLGLGKKTENKKAVKVKASNQLQIGAFDVQEPAPSAPASPQGFQDMSLRCYSPVGPAEFTSIEQSGSAQTTGYSAFAGAQPRLPVNISPHNVVPDAPAPSAHDITRTAHPTKMGDAFNAYQMPAIDDFSFHYPTPRYSNTRGATYTFDMQPCATFGWWDRLQWQVAMAAHQDPQLQAEARWDGEPSQSGSFGPFGI